MLLKLFCQSCWHWPPIYQHCHFSVLMNQFQTGAALLPRLCEDHRLARDLRGECGHGHLLGLSLVNTIYTGLSLVNTVDTGLLLFHNVNTLFWLVNTIYTGLSWANTIDTGLLLVRTVISLFWLVNTRWVWTGSAGTSPTSTARRSSWTKPSSRWVNIEHFAQNV